MAMAKEALDERYMEIFSKVDAIPDRDEKNIVLTKLIGELQQRKEDSLNLDDFEQKLVEFYESEWDHQYLVCRALRRVGNKRRHDWSKDFVYIYVLGGKFCFQVDHPDFSTKWTEEVNRHYKLEPHHCQHTLTGGVINRIDVQEMAVDQLAREVYRHKGKIDNENMRKYLPKFEGEDAAQKLEWFKGYIDENRELMIQVYDEYILEGSSAGRCTML